MFSSPKRTESFFTPESSSISSNATVIAKGVKVEGEFTSQGDVVIEGEVHGHVSTIGLLSIGSEAKLKADIAAQEAVIAGVVEGNTVIKGRLELKSTAKIFGDVTCETAVVEAGAIMSGKVAIGNAKNESSSARHEKTNKNNNSSVAVSE